MIIHSEETKKKISLSKMGSIPWNKGKKGSQVAWNKGIKYLQITGDKHHAWKGDKACYFAIHSWINRVLGTPRFCVECRSTSEKRYEWANISKTYKRDITDYKRLCTKCHKKFDPESVQRGEIVKTSVLKNKQVLQIRELNSNKKLNQNQLARRFKVSQTTIWGIINRLTWKHI